MIKSERWYGCPKCGARDVAWVVIVPGDFERDTQKFWGFAYDDLAPVTPIEFCPHCGVVLVKL